MVTTGYITQAEADAAKTAAPNLQTPTFATKGDLVAPHFVFYIRQLLINYIGGDPALAEQKLDDAGLTVTTSLDLDTQAMAQSVLSSMGPTMVKNYNASNASITAVDPNTGEVLAMVGSIDYNNSISGNTNSATAGLQPGSSFKPFVYATAFNKTFKKSPSSITFDLPTDFGGGYTPNYYDGKFRGPVTDRNALAGSLNIPAVKTLGIVGVQNAINTAHSMGITTLNADPSTYGLSLVLGSGEVRAVDMANAYGAFANGGMEHDLRPILTIAQSGKVVKDYTTTTGTQAIEPDVAYEINSILSDINAKKPIFGSLANNFALPSRMAAAKSGTTQNNRDGWTVGYTPQISVAVWVGNNLPSKTMTKGADGSVVAAPIWKQFMTEYLAGKPAVNFAQPSDIQTITVDELSGKLPTDQSPPDQHITDVFAPWQVPTTTDDVHQLVKVDKVSGKLATSLTPPEDIVSQYYFSIHSEMPNNPGWENPVQDWAKANGGSTPPTQTDDVHTSANQPSLTITSPSDGATITGPFTIAANAGGNSAITKVEFFINNVSVGTATQAPWQISYDAASLPAGTEVIQATATNELGLTTTVQVTVTKGDATPSPSPPPPGPVKNVSVINGSKIANKPVHISWTNTSDTSVITVAIYQSSTSGALGSQVKSIQVAPGASSSADLLITTPGTYYFTLRSTDSSGSQDLPGVTVSGQVLP